MTIDRMSSGRAMPSMPMWYRLLMTSIQLLLTSYWRRPASS